MAVTNFTICTPLDKNLIFLLLSYHKQGNWLSNLYLYTEVQRSTSKNVTLLASAASKGFKYNTDILFYSLGDF